MSNFKTAMKLTSVNLALEFVANSDKDEISFKTTKSLLDCADEIYNYILEDVEEGEGGSVISLVDFNGEPH